MNIGRDAMDLYVKLLRGVELIILVAVSMIAAFMVCTQFFGRDSWLSIALPLIVGAVVLVWRVRRIPEFWEWGLTHEQRLKRYSAQLSEERLKSLSAEEYEKYKNDVYSKNYGWERHYQHENPKDKELIQMLLQKAAAAVNAVIASKIFDVLCFVGGPVLAAYGLFSFLSVDSLFIYNHSSKTMIASGVGLVGFGVVKRLWNTR